MTKLLAPLTGKIVSVNVKPGDKVPLVLSYGDYLTIAMIMIPCCSNHVYSSHGTMFTVINDKSS